jgi:ribonuclease Z
MLNNVPLKSIKHQQWTIEGWSRAAVQSYYAIPELNLGFDLGAHAWHHMGIPNWLITHCHLDHIAAIPVYVARRRMMKMPPPTIYLPAFSIPAIQSILRSYERLDRGRLPCNLVGVEAGQEFELSRELVLQVVATRHTVPSVGYIVQDRRKKLKPQYAEMTGEQIRDLRISGVEIAEEKRLPLMGYTGDTTPEGLDENPEFYLTKILITELTFLAEDHQRHLVHKHGHMHLDDLVKRKHRFQNELIIAGHCSTRYNSNEALQIVRQALPDLLGGRLKLWV